MPADPTQVRLGKLAPRHDDRTLQLARYLDPATLPPPPPVLTVPALPSWPMYANDRLGDCTCAATGHMVMGWTDLEKRLVTPAEADVIALYDRVNGGVDEGAACLDVLNEWRKNGLGSDKIDAYAQINVADETEVRVAAWLFGGLYLGVALPLSAQGQGEWAIPVQPTSSPAPGSWGGHCVDVVGYDTQGVWVITWGEALRMTWEFWAAYVDEAYAVRSKPDWVGDVVGFNAAQLDADLAALPS